MKPKSTNRTPAAFGFRTLDIFVVEFRHSQTHFEIMNGANLEKRPALLPPQGWFGLALTAISWPLNWTMPGNRTAYLFFPLWLGYILVVDALVFYRTGSSLWSRSRRDFVLLFVASAPVS